MKNTSLLFLFIFSLIFSIPAVAQLNPGDIMIVGFMGDGDGTPIPTATDPPSANCGDGFSFVCMVDIPVGEQVIFTEEEWSTSGFDNGNEGHVIWTNNTGSPIGSGTVVQVTTHGQQEVSDGNCGLLETTVGDVVFGDDGSGNDIWALSSSNEEIYVYQGAPEAPTRWISAFFTDDFNVSSFAPPALTGFIVDLESIDPDADVAVYTGATDCSDPAACLASIIDLDNWSTDNGAGFQCCDDTGIEYPTDVRVAFEGLFCQSPVIVCPPDVTISCEDSSDPSSTGVASATAGCGAVVISFTDTETAGACTNAKTIARVWTATDADGNTSVCAQTITIVDETAPAAPAAPADLAVQCADDVPAPVELTAIDNCNGDITVGPTAVMTPGSCGNEFVIVRTWTFIDDCGNSSSVSQTITVKDVTAPTAPTAPVDLTVQCAEDVPAPVELTAIDNCNGDITVGPTAVMTPGSCGNDFVMVRTWTFTDDCGNTSSVSQTITVKDDTAPAAPAAPADLTVQCAEDVPAPVELTAIDNCNGDIKVGPTAVMTPGSCANDFVMVRTWTFTDDCGNTSSVSQTITVLDTTSPTISGISNGEKILDSDPGFCNTVTDYSFIRAADNCTGDVALSFSPVAGTFLPVGITSVTVTATDACGNTTLENFDIRVVDREDPVISCPANITVNSDPDACGTILKYATPKPSDNCPGVTVALTGGLGSGAYFPVGTTVETYTATDAEGNTATCSFMVTVIDTSPPEITTKSEPLILWPPNHKYHSINVADFVLNVSDECSQVSLSDVVITQVTSDEPENATGGGDGNTLDDILIGQDCQSVDLRVERQGSGNGRVYTVTVVVIDEGGNSATAEYQVHIPKSNKKNAIDDGTAYIVNGCGNTTARMANNSAILIDENLLEEVLIYPNPVKDIVTIELTAELVNGVEPIEVNIYDVNGVEVSNNNHRFVHSNRLEVDMKELPAGVYIMTIPNQGNYTKHRITKM